MAPATRAGLRHLGYLSEDEKQAALAGASVVVCPSAYESLSIALLEGFAVGTPGLVNAASAVLKEHCLRSNAGLFYGDGDEFGEALARLIGDSGLRRALGEAGRRYVEVDYRWEVVLDRYRALIEAAAGGGGSEDSGGRALAAPPAVRSAAFRMVRGLLPPVRRRPARIQSSATRSGTSWPGRRRRGVPALPRARSARPLPCAERSRASYALWLRHRSSMLAMVASPPRRIRLDVMEFQEGALVQRRPVAATNAQRPRSRSQTLRLTSAGMSASPGRVEQALRGPSAAANFFCARSARSAVSARSRMTASSPEGSRRGATGPCASRSFWSSLLADGHLDL